MAQQVVTGAQLLCTFGAAPSVFSVVPTGPPVKGGGVDAATIMDNKPLMNIKPFGTCMSLANPTVASATAAALGVLTPMPCIPNVAAPWAPGSPTVHIGNKPALNSSSKAICNYGGQISILSPGQFTVSIP